MIRDFKSDDLTQIAEILNYYVKNDTCIFQMEPYSLEELAAKFDKILLTYPIFVAEKKDKIVGFSYGSRWREKPAYAKSVETTIYVHHQCHHQGIGESLYNKLIAALSEMNFHLLVAGMTLPNDGSKKLHEKLGFQYVGKFTDAGIKFDRWHDVGFWQKIL